MGNRDANDTLYSSDRRRDYQNAIDYHEKRLKTAQEIGDRSRRRNSLWKSGIAYHSSEYRKAIEYHKRRLKIGNR